MGMIRIRDIYGNATTLKDGAAVEICSEDGDLAALVFSDGAVIQLVEAGDKDMEVYAQHFGLKMATIHKMKRGTT